MKNPQGCDLQDRLVEPEEIEILGLEQFTQQQLLKMGWKWMPLIEVDYPILKLFVLQWLLSNSASRPNAHNACPTHHEKSLK